MISRELLKEVFKKEWRLYQPNPDPAYQNVPFEITDITEWHHDERYVFNHMMTINGKARDNRDWSLEINTYELAHRCKVFMSEKYLLPISSFKGNDNLWWASVNILENFAEFSADTEPEAIFLACDYIVKEHK